ncbi:MAG: HEAT repeat domain-containing protein [Pirellulaceae bacterium]|nr:HEAT repeat domain-containing protein [Pirellulaceae bacterium]
MARHDWFEISRRSMLLQAGIALAAGCQSTLYRAQSGDQAEVLSQMVDDERGDTLVGDFAVPTGMNFVRIDSVAMVIGLGHTGSKPPNSMHRDRLLGEMRSHNVEHPEAVLDSDETALALVRGYLRPGIQKGDWIDIAVDTPRRSKTTSLRGGWLMPSRMRQVAMVGSSVREGHVDAIAAGHLFVNALFESGAETDAREENVARVYGGARALKSRPVGLSLRSRHTSIKTSTMIAAAINDRFDDYTRAGKDGVASPKNHRYVELAIVPKYKNNIRRYMRVIQSIAVGESPSMRGQRLQDLERMLQEPATASKAALRLEAVGEDAISILMQGLHSTDPEVQFYASEALGYLGAPEAAPVLAHFAATERAFRWHAISALSTMDHVAAYEALGDLLDHSSAETRYGAFLAMQARNPRDPMLGGEQLGESFMLHMINSAKEPMIHIARSRRPEIVLFGRQQPMVAPEFLFAGPKILVKAQPNGQLRVHHHRAGDDADISVTCNADVEELIRAIVEVGGGYGEVFQALHEAKQAGSLRSRLVVDARPRPNRTYHRREETEGGGEVETSRYFAPQPLPELFSNQLDRDEEPAQRETPYTDVGESSDGWLSRMKGWFSSDDS